jgi:isopentenyldiphosphate isomerase
MLENQINIFEYLNISSTFKSALFEDVKEAVWNLPDSPHKPMKYKHYIDLMYLAVFKKTAKKLRNEYGITKNQSLSQIFTYKQKLALKRVEIDICTLLAERLEYIEIKEIIVRKYENMNLRLTA